MRTYFKKVKSKNSSGFSMVEIVMGMVVVSMGIFLVSALFQQVANLSKSSKQTAAILELRNRNNAMIRNPDSFLLKMKGLGTSGVGFATCLATGAGATFVCPPTDKTLLDKDEELKRLAGAMHVIDTPVVDANGEKIAGTINEPHYLGVDGTLCTLPPTECALRSTGYFLRQHDSTNSTPGFVKFIIKIEKNPDAKNKAVSLPMKTQYMTMDVGEAWSKSPAADCETGMVKVGYLSSGDPQCVNPTVACPTGQVQIGLKLNGQPSCQKLPTNCKAPQTIILNAANNEMMCSDISECTSGVFAGYYTATGQPMCLSSPPSCALGQVQMGMNGSNPICVGVPSCTKDKPHLSYNGTSFNCQATKTENPSGSGIDCGDGKYLQGISSTGVPLCASASGLGGGDGSDGGDGADGKDAPVLTCSVTRTTYKGTPVCCNDPDEIAMAAVSPKDIKSSSYEFLEDERCMKFNAVGVGNPVQLRCCKFGTSTTMKEVITVQDNRVLTSKFLVGFSYDCGSGYIPVIVTPPKIYKVTISGSKISSGGCGYMGKVCFAQKPDSVQYTCNKN